MSFVRLNVGRLDVGMLDVVMLSVVAPCQEVDAQTKKTHQKIYNQWLAL